MLRGRRKLIDFLLCFLRSLSFFLQRNHFEVVRSTQHEMVVFSMQSFGDLFFNSVDALHSICVLLHANDFGADSLFKLLHTAISTPLAMRLSVHGLYPFHNQNYIIPFTNMTRVQKTMLYDCILSSQKSGCFQGQSERNSYYIQLNTSARDITYASIINLLAAMIVLLRKTPKSTLGCFSSEEVTCLVLERLCASTQVNRQLIREAFVQAEGLNADCMYGDTVSSKHEYLQTHISTYKNIV